MNPSALTALQLAIGDLEQELSQTRRILERVPEEHLDWRPHEKSWTLGELAQHIVNLPFWQTRIVEADEFDLATSPPPSAGPRSREELLERFDRSATALRDAVARLDEQALGARWTLRQGDRVLIALPRAAVLRGMGISHLIHHRGQLTVYLRLLDTPVPGLYGPSADERG